MGQTLSAVAWVFLLLLSRAHAEPYFDPRVQDFLKSSAFQFGHNDKLSVIVLMASESKLKDGAPINPTLLNQIYRQETQEHIKALKQKLSWANKLHIEPLWLVKGLLLNATAKQIRAIVAATPAQAVVWARKPIRLQAARTGQREAAHAANQKNSAERYTYGLTNIKAPEMRLRQPPLLGNGVRVGILDTGIAPQHPDLVGRLKLFKNFSPATDEAPRDDFGHGTHVAGTIAGGLASGTAIGVAPRAELIVGRIFDGNGLSENALIIKAMQWMADPDNDPHTNDFAQIVNNSWSDDAPFSDRNPDDEPFCRAVKTWVDLGIVPVFSAGNTGPRVGSINIPAGCPEAFSVGATEQYDRSPHFSSTGPAVWRDYRLVKPEVSAPGFKIYSAHRMNGYETMSGTSMAAPHVSGAFAILLQAQPQATAEELKRMMIRGSKDLGEPGQDGIFGWGRIDLVQSLDFEMSRPR